MGPGTFWESPLTGCSHRLPSKDVPSAGKWGCLEHSLDSRRCTSTGWPRLFPTRSGEWGFWGLSRPPWASCVLVPMCPQSRGQPRCGPLHFPPGLRWDPGGLSKKSPAQTLPVGEEGHRAPCLPAACQGESQGPRCRRGWLRAGQASGVALVAFPVAGSEVPRQGGSRP